MRESELIVLAVIGDFRPPQFVLIGPDMPGAMLRHAEVCRSRGWAFAADPSQQLAGMIAIQAREFIAGAAYLFTNEYEYDLLLTKTGMTQRDLLEMVGMTITTRGAGGVRLADRRGEVTVPAVPVTEVVDPTGSGDAFRAGFVSATTRGLPPVVAAQISCQVAARCLAESGPQSYDPDVTGLAGRLRLTYGDSSADLVASSFRAGEPQPAVP